MLLQELQHFTKLCMSCRRWDTRADRQVFAFCLTHGFISSNSPVSSRPWLVRWVRAQALFNVISLPFGSWASSVPRQLDDPFPEVLWRATAHCHRFWHYSTVRIYCCASCVHQGDEGGGKVMWLSGLHLPESYLPAQVQVRMQSATDAQFTAWLVMSSEDCWSLFTCRSPVRTWSEQTGRWRRIRTDRGLRLQVWNTSSTFHCFHAFSFSLVPHCCVFCPAEYGPRLCGGMSWIQSWMELDVDLSRTMHLPHWCCRESWFCLTDPGTFQTVCSVTMDFFNDKKIPQTDEQIRGKPTSYDYRLHMFLNRLFEPHQKSRLILFHYIPLYSTSQLF